MKKTAFYKLHFLEIIFSVLLIVACVYLTVTSFIYDQQGVALTMIIVASTTLCLDVTYHILTVDEMDNLERNIQFLRGIVLAVVPMLAAIGSGVFGAGLVKPWYFMFGFVTGCGLIAPVWSWTRWNDYRQRRDELRRQDL